MKKLIIFCLLALTYTGIYAQHEETYSNDWGEWESCRDFEGIKFRIKSNSVKGLNYSSAEIEFKNEYQTGIEFHYFTKDIFGREKSINNEVDWHVMWLNKGQMERDKLVRLKFDEETLDVYIGGVTFSKTIKYEITSLKLKYSHTEPEIDLSDDLKGICIYCTLFKENNEIFCPKGKEKDISNPWSSYGTASLGQKITKAEADAKKAEMEKFVKSPTGTAIVVGASAVVITKSLSDVAKLNKEYKKEEEQYIKDNIGSFKKDKNESDESAFSREIRDNKRKKVGRLFVEIIGGAIGAGLGLLLLSNSK